jgi:hypothetical protein
MANVNTPATCLDQIDFEHACLRGKRRTGWGRPGGNDPSAFHPAPGCAR